MKTHSATSKRFKKLKSGKIKFTHSFKRHLLTKKNSKRKRDLRRAAFICTSDMSHFRKLLPYN